MMKRPYRQTVRAAAAEATRERILDIFAKYVRASWIDEIRLEDVARAADVTVQTIIRRFGTKEGLLTALCDRADKEIRMRRGVDPGDIDAAVRVLTDDYENIGDLIMRFLAQEDRYPALRAFTDMGRSAHREWVGAAFSPWLASLSEIEARRRLDGLVVAMDVYVWVLVRRDMNRPIDEYQALARTLISSVLAGTSPSHPQLPHTGGKS